MEGDRPEWLGLTEGEPSIPCEFQSGDEGTGESSTGAQRPVRLCRRNGGQALREPQDSGLLFQQGGDPQHGVGDAPKVGRRGAVTDIHPCRASVGLCDEERSFIDIG